MVLVFCIILCTDCCVWKTAEIIRFWKTQTSPSGTNNHTTCKITEIRLILILILFRTLPHWVYLQSTPECFSIARKVHLGVTRNLYRNSIWIPQDATKNVEGYFTLDKPNVCDRYQCVYSIFIHHGSARARTHAASQKCWHFYMFLNPHIDTGLAIISTRQTSVQRHINLYYIYVKMYIYTVVEHAHEQI